MLCTLFTFISTYKSYGHDNANVHRLHMNTYTLNPGTQSSLSVRQMVPFIFNDFHYQNAFKIRGKIREIQLNKPIHIFGFRYYFKLPRLPEIRFSNNGVRKHGVSCHTVVKLSFAQNLKVVYFESRIDQGSSMEYDFLCYKDFIIWRLTIKTVCDTP